MGLFPAYRGGAIAASVLQEWSLEHVEKDGL
jgi:hypothetical protein